MRTTLFYLLGAGGEFDLLKPDGAFGRSTVLQLTDILLIIGAGLALAALLVLWAVYWRKAKRHKRHHHHHHKNHQPEAAEKRELVAEPVEHTSANAEEEDEGPEERLHGHQHHRRRIRRREHRHRNPTLAETGGLPPMRDPNAPPPPI
jgi:ABC-type nickel/cobalt efflux system permease component RcnA